MPSFEKNQTPSGSIALEMRDASGAFVSGTPTVTVSKDGGAYAAYAGTLVAISGATGEWEYTPTSAETNAGKFKVKATLAGAVAVTREVLPEPSYTAARASYLDALNGIVASVWGYAARSLTSTADSSGVTTLLGRLTAGRATAIDNLDAAVSSRLATSGYAAPPTDVAIRSDVQAAMTSQGYTTVRAGYLDTLNGLVASVWGYAARTLTAATDSSGIATLLGRLTAGRAGNLDNLDAAVSSRSTYAGGAVASVTTPVTVGTNNDKTGYRLSATAGALDGIQPNAAFFTNSPTGLGAISVSVPAVLPGYTVPEGDLPPIRRGDSWGAQLTGLGGLTPRTKLWATAKRDPRRTDAQADFQMSEGGLAVIAGAAPAAGQAAGLVVNDAATGAITLTLSAAATAALGPGELEFDVQILVGTTVRTLTSGRVTVVADVTRAVG